jgi:hypothetical protein
MGARELAVATFLAAASFATPVCAQSVSTPELLDRATAYVQQFVREFSNVVAEEQYVQESQKTPRETGSGFSRAFVPGTPERRELQSDFLLVRTDESSDWFAFRDVFSVDGRAVRDRQERLTKLFSQPTAFALQQVRQVALESARYNLSPRRTINNPLLALGMLQARYRDRFDFSARGSDASVGANVIVVQYKERVRPTVLQTPGGRDLPVSGRFWIDAPTGRVLKTQLDTDGADSVSTTFAADSQFQIDVPVEMREAYEIGDASATGIARYGRFRRFTVQTDEQLRR